MWVWYDLVNPVFKFFFMGWIVSWCILLNYDCVLIVRESGISRLLVYQVDLKWFASLLGAVA